MKWPIVPFGPSFSHLINIVSCKEMRIHQFGHRLKGKAVQVFAGPIESLVFGSHVIRNVPIGEDLLETL